MVDNNKINKLENKKKSKNYFIKEEKTNTV